MCLLFLMFVTRSLNVIPFKTKMAKKPRTFTIRLTMFLLGAPVNWVVCSKSIIRSSTFEILSDVFSGGKSHAKYCASQIWKCAVIGLTAPFNRRWEPLRKWQAIGWGRLFTAGLTSEWSLPWDQAPHLRKKENEIGVGVKKKGRAKWEVV